MYCSKCNKLNDINNEFCESCGNHLKEEKDQKIISEKTNNASMMNSKIGLNENVHNITSFYNPHMNTNNNVSKKKKYGCLIAFIIFIVLILAVIGLIFLIIRSKGGKENYEFIKEYEYLSILDNGEYIISNVSEDAVFYVASNTSYEIIDEDGNKIETVLEDNKIINPLGYDKGKEYTIVINSGNFVSEQLKNINKVTFKIERDKVKEHKFKENVIKVNRKDLKINNEKTSFTSNKKYNIGDILTINNGDSISEAYVVEGINNNVYNIRPAKINEIFSKLDYYYEDYVDLTNYEVSSQIKQYVIGNVKSSPWYKNIVETVYAEPEFEIELNTIDNGIEAIVTLTVESGDNSLLVNSKYHDIEIVFKQQLIINQLVDITLDDWNVSYNITSNQEFELNLKNDFLEYKDANTDKATKELLDKIKNAIENAEYTDVDEKEEELATILIPTGVPCLNVELELKLINELNISAEFGFNVGQNTNIVVGFDYGQDEEFKFIGSYDKKLSDVTLSFIGNVEEKFGLELSIGLDLLNVVSVKADVATGLYATAELGVSSTLGNESSFTISASTEGGIFLDFGATAQLAVLKHEHKFIDQKWKLFEKSWTTSYPKEEINNSSNGINSNETDKFSYEVSENRLEQFSCVDSLEDDTYIKYKFNYNNGKFENVELVSAFYVNTGIEFIDDLIKLIFRILSIYFEFHFKTPSNYYESGNYSYIVIKIDKNDYRTQIEELADVKDENYNSFKVKMEENGYICK